MLLVVVYVGAVAVLFLFVVMMLDVDFSQLRTGLRPATCRSAVLVAAVLTDRDGHGGHRRRHPRRGLQQRRALASPDGVPNAEAIGRVLYTDYIYFFQGWRAWCCWWP